jgi:hypothetical protein
MPPVPFKVPAWADPNNASVLDSPLQKAARTLGGMFGAADPQAQVMAIATPLELPKVEIGNLGTALGAQRGTAAAYQPGSGRVMLDREAVQQMLPEQRAALVRHELAHKVESESDLWKDTDTALWKLWEKDPQHPIFDFMGERTGHSRMSNSVSPEILAELYSTEYPKGTFTVDRRPVPYPHEAGQSGPREYPIPTAIRSVLDRVENQLGIWGKKQARGTAK